VRKPVVDLVIANYPNGLCVPEVSHSSKRVPFWNEQVQDFLKLTIGFYAGFLHDDGAFLLFYPHNSLLFSFFNKNNLKVKEEWTVINSLHLRHPFDASKLVRTLLATLLDWQFFLYSL